MSETPQQPRSNRMLSAWDSRQQARYREHNASLVFHFVLDASPSMLGRHASHLRASFNQYLLWLRAHADPMAMAEVRCFSDYLDPSHLVPLGMLTPLTEQSYDPRQGNGTALYRAIGETLTTALTSRDGGQHCLVVFTDGLDNRSEQYHWSVSKVCEVLQVLVAQQAWLAVFLGAMPNALHVGQALGFARNNCLLMTTDHIPEAFTTLTTATQRYLQAGPQQRKLLTQAGVF